VRADRPRSFPFCHRHRPLARLVSPILLFFCSLSVVRVGHPLHTCHAAPELSAKVAARRALQELLLESTLREIDECGSEGCGSLFDDVLGNVQRAGEETRRQLARRALNDVNRLRSSIVDLLAATEREAEGDASRARSEQQYGRLVEGVDPWLTGWQLEEASRRAADTRLLRRSLENDLNQLELQLLQGDPTLAFIRNVLMRTRAVPLEPRSMWLREQMETGALPRDPELMRTLLEQVRQDPKLVERLVTQAKDPEGKDLYTRSANEPVKLNAEGEPVWATPEVGNVDLEMGS
jgi:hypothetical protein